MTAPLHRSWAARLQRAGAFLAALAGVTLLAALPAAAQSYADVGGVAPNAGQDAPAVAPVPPPSGTPADAESAGVSEELGARPAPAHHHPKKPRRGGINPCMTPDPGFGIYDPWDHALPVGQMLAPHEGGVTKSGGFDLIVHFHGHEAVRKEFVKTAKGIVLVGVDLGIGSGAYSSAFSSPHVFTDLLAAVEAEMSKKIGKKAHIRKLALSSWSAGYGAVDMILRQPAAKRVDAVILLDSLHAGYVDEQAHTLKTAQLEPFVAFAERAAHKGKLMYMSHSSIVPPGYASTTEVAHYLVKELHGKPRHAKRADVLGLDMFERFDKGFFHMRGYTGEDKPDHCAHIGLMADIVKVYLNARWHPPKGRR